MEDSAEKGNWSSSSGDQHRLTLLLGLDDTSDEWRRTYRADDLSREFRTDRQALRGYEKLGLLRPTTDGDGPLYSSTDRTRLRIALLGELLGLSSDDVARLVDHYTSGEA